MTSTATTAGSAGAASAPHVPAPPHKHNGDAGPVPRAHHGEGRRAGCPTVVVALAHLAHDDRRQASAAARLVHDQLGQALGSVQLTDPNSLVESLLDSLAAPRWPVDGGTTIEHGIRVLPVQEIGPPRCVC